jgi:hypothetical protein
VIRFYGKVAWTALLALALLATPVAAQQAFQILVNPASFGTNSQVLGVAGELLIRA